MKMKKLTFDVAFAIGDVVYLKTDVEQLSRIVVGYSIRSNEVMYDLQHGADSVTSHYSFEISEQVDAIKNSTN